MVLRTERGSFLVVGLVSHNGCGASCCGVGTFWFGCVGGGGGGGGGGLVATRTPAPADAVMVKCCEPVSALPRMLAQPRGHCLVTWRLFGAVALVMGANDGW